MDDHEGDANGRGSRAGPPNVVDPAAVIAASLAVVIAWELGPGEWGPSSIPVGVLVISVVFGFYSHPPELAGRTWRRRMQVLAFSALISLGICILVAWPIQDVFFVRVIGIDDEDEAARLTTEALTGLWILVTIAIARFEPTILAWLDRAPRVGKRHQADD